MKSSTGQGLPTRSFCLEVGLRLTAAQQRGVR